LKEVREVREVREVEDVEGGWRTLKEVGDVLGG
jgi:hypothetical protein